jgi:hypothetical protein
MTMLDMLKIRPDNVRGNRIPMGWASSAGFCIYWQSLLAESSREITLVSLMSVGGWGALSAASSPGEEGIVAHD